ncbi:hypothetical protein BF17_04355 [Yersinia similis]|uniref:Prophage protein n=1 Tax=Yersinia similis TaxID=367190 RepID=A0ABN4CT19_9GAMM|nr:hypothetical protein [Yersinia similis]AHK21920.1 hypothetical protein BF17_04355 [Yersinia similis]CFQ73023.1 Uncharacterised protein [Yersinia similis]CNF35416.1 Uncharacterised protein [Yersinia similis]
MSDQITLDLVARKADQLSTLLMTLSYILDSLDGADKKTLLGLASDLAAPVAIFVMEMNEDGKHA